MKQRYIISAIFSLTVATLLIACSDDVAPFGEKNAQNSQLGIDKEKVTFDMNRSATVKVTATTGLNWEVLWSVGWINVSRTNGNGSSDITISTNDDNPDTTPRTSYVTIASKRYGLKKTIAVEQKGGYIEVSSPVINFPAISDRQTITVRSNVSWSLIPGDDFTSVIESISPLEGTPGATTITLKSRNSTKAQYDGSWFQIIPNGWSNIPYRGVTVSREGVTLEATIVNNNVLFTQSGGSFTLNVKSNSEWKISSLASWLKPSITRGTKNQTVNFTVESNGLNGYRQCTFCVEAGEVKTWLKIGQDGSPVPYEDDNATPRYK